MVLKKITTSVRVVTFLALAVGCGSSGGSNGSGTVLTGSPPLPPPPTSSGSTGEVSIAVTDAPTDQIQRFEVDVTSVNLTRQDGTKVAVLPQKERIDFAELITVSHLLTSYSIAAGNYTHVEITMDMSTADVMLTGASAAARVTDENGSTLSGSVTRDIKLDTSRPLVVAPGLHKTVELDFDLDGSCVVDTTANTVALGPVLKADASPQAPKIARIAGVIASIDSTAQSFVVELRSPFSTATRPKVTVKTSSATIFMVDGVKGTFSDLSVKPAGTPVLAHGRLDTASKTFAADAVEAWTAGDMARGHVISRTVDGILTIKGGAVELASGTRMLNQTFTVDAKSAKVFRRLFGQTQLKADDIGVGQHVFAYGTMSGSTLTAKHVALTETGIFGFAKGAVAGGVLTIDLARFGGRPVADFDFSVGGTASADPKSYTIATSTLNLASITSGSPVAVRGMISAWNAPASTPEATADGVADRADSPSCLFVGWPATTAAPFVSSSSAEAVLSLADTGKRAVDDGHVAAIQLATTDKPRIVPDTNGKTFVIGDKTGALTIYTTFAAWQADVTTKLATQKVRYFGAKGKWDQATKTLTANMVGICFQ